MGLIITWSNIVLAYIGRHRQAKPAALNFTVGPNNTQHSIIHPTLSNP